MKTALAVIFSLLTFTANAQTYLLPNATLPLTGNEFVPIDQAHGNVYNTVKVPVTNILSGAVTSVTFTGDGVVLSSTPSTAVTTTGTLLATLKTQLANKVLAGPTSGGVSTPTFRSLVIADLPVIACSNLSNSGAGCTAGVMTSTVGGLVPTPPNDATQVLLGNGTFGASPGGGATCAGCTTDVVPKTTGVGTLGDSGRTDTGTAITDVISNSDTVTLSAGVVGSLLGAEGLAVIGRAGTFQFGLTVKPSDVATESSGFLEVISVDDGTCAGSKVCPASIYTATTRGTLATPTALQSGDWVGGQYGFFGANGTGGTIDGARNWGATIEAFATENFDGTNGGTRLVLSVAHNGSTTPTADLSIGGSGGVLVGAAAGGFPGPDKINATTYYAGGTTGIVSCTAVTLGATVTIKGGIITAFTGC